MLRPKTHTRRRRVLRPPTEHCWYCGANESHDNVFVFDHVVPRILNGGDERENLVIACWSCNSRKAGRSVEWLREQIAHGQSKLAPRQIELLKSLGVDLTPYFDKIANTVFFGEANPDKVTSHV